MPQELAYAIIMLMSGIFLMLAYHLSQGLKDELGTILTVIFFWILFIIIGLMFYPA